MTREQAIRAAAETANVSAHAFFDGLLVGPRQWCGNERSNVSKPIAWELGELAAQRGVPNGEALWRYAAARGFTDTRAWSMELPQRKAAYQLFLVSFSEAFRLLMLLQGGEIARNIQTTPAAALRLEDSIFEPDEPLSTLRPEAIEAARFTAEVRNNFEGNSSRAQNAANCAPADKPDEAFWAAQHAAARQPLSIGEGPVRPPVNRGGRGHRKDS